MITDLNEAELTALNAEDAPIQIPNLESDFVNAKSFLQKGSSVSGDNLYDHLTDVLNKILAERPENIVDFFEEYCRRVKEKRFKALTDHLEDIFVPPGRYKVAKRLIPLLKPLPPGPPSTMDPEDLELADMTQRNMLQLLHHLEHAGLGIPRIDMFALGMSMRKLIHKEPLASIRFWGKVYGLYNNYYVIETTLKDEEYGRRNEAEALLAEALQQQQQLPPEAPRPDELNQLQTQLEEVTKRQEMEGEGAPLPAKLWDFLPPIPLSDHHDEPEPPNEISGVGLNKNVFYVCNEIGEEWIQLPDVTPKQIRVARQIYKSMTGDLEHSVVAYPEFPGVEKNYLRAQLARITAGTHVSPLGFYSFGGGEEMGEEEELDEEAEEGGDRSTVRENPKFDPLPIKELVDKSMMFWVHHSPNVLNQGRVTWWNPNPLPEMQGEDMGADEEDEGLGGGAGGVEPETGPPLLTPCSEDVTLDGIPAWSVRCSSAIAEEYGVAVVRSNFWPGAYCVATQGKLFENVYFGSGLKFLAPNFSPTPLPNVEQDYPTGPEIMEIVDPTGAEEEEWRIAHLPKEKPPKLPEDEELEEEEEEEDEDEDDD